MRPIRLVDSITELAANNAGCIAVGGSHGGISSAHYALDPRQLLSLFNDAGVSNRLGLRRRNPRVESASFVHKIALWRTKNGRWQLLI